MNGTRRVTIRGLIVLAVVGSGLAAFASPVNGAGDDAASGSAALVINTTAGPSRRVPTAWPGSP